MTIAGNYDSTVQIPPLLHMNIQPMNIHSLNHYRVKVSLKISSNDQAIAISCLKNGPRFPQFPPDKARKLKMQIIILSGGKFKESPTLRGLVSELLMTSKR